MTDHPLVKRFGHKRPRGPVDGEENAGRIVPDQSWS